MTEDMTARIAFEAAAALVRVALSDHAAGGVAVALSRQEARQKALR